MQLALLRPGSARRLAVVAVSLAAAAHAIAAPDDDSAGWAFRPLADVEVAAPAPFTDAPAANPIDLFIDAALAERGLRPSPPADRRALIRRLTYDLTGLPPELEEVEAFVADRSVDARERLADRLLASPRHGEHWGRHWLDIVRFGESRGFERNEIINNAWPFRDYVIRAFNEDRRFDRVILEHLAGDVIGAGDPAAEIGAAFLVSGPYDDVGNQDAVQAAQIRANTIDEMIRAAGEAFLGVTVGCARCHDHKFDPIAQADYYGLHATFAGVHHGSRVVATPAAREEHARRLAPLIETRDRLARDRAAVEEDVLRRAETRAAEHESRWTRPPVDRTGTEETFDPVDARFVRLVVDGLDTDPRARAGYRLDEFEVWTAGDSARNVALAANGGRAEGASRVAEDFSDAYGAALAIDGRFGARWIAAGPELTITLARPERVGRVVFSSDRPGAAGALGEATFVSDYRIEVSLDGLSWTTVADSRDRRPVSAAHRRARLLELELRDEERRRLAAIDAELARVGGQIAAIEPLPSWWVGTTSEAKGPFHVFLGGDPQKRGPEATPASLTALEGVAAGYRLPPETPEGERRLALARWIVAPDNPLAPRVLANRIWHYHFGRGIVDTPSDLGAMGGRPTHPELLDWLAGEVRRRGWRLKSLHRLVVTSRTWGQDSTWREDAAAADGDSRLLWRFPPRRLSGEELRDSMLAVAGALDTRMGGPGFRLYRYIQDNVATYIPLDVHGPETYRRAVYHQNARAARVDLMTDFDCPDCALPAPRRVVTTTPLQALTLLNHRFTLDVAAMLAARLEREAGADAAARVDRAFALVFSRPPAAAEREAAVRFIEEFSPRAFCRALLNANELISID